MKSRFGPLPAPEVERRHADPGIVLDRIERAASAGGTALIADGVEIGYRELWDLVERATDLLSTSGAFEGQGQVARIGLAYPNGLAHVALALAILRGGGCVVPIAEELSPPEREALVRTTRLDVVLSAPSATWLDGARRSPRISLPGLEVALTRSQSLGAAQGFAEDSFAALDPAFVRLSSGTTGASKGVVLSHDTIGLRLAAVNQGLGMAPDDRVVWYLPMAHHFVSSILLFLSAGATIVLTSSPLGKDLLDAAREHRATVLYGAPYQYALLAAETSGASVPSLRLAVSTAASLSETTAADFLRRFRVPLTQALGIIEVGLPVMNLASARDKPLAVGRPLPGFALELRDERGRLVSPGEVGEVHLCGPGMLDAYLSPWRTREDIAPQGWFATGDLGRQDADGDLWLVGRSRTVVNVAGLKCFPEEVEAVLLEHPQVRAARVRPKPHRRIGAVPVAEIVPLEPDAPPSEASLAAHCRARLARFKVPVEFELVDAISTTASGKIKRA